MMRGLMKIAWSDLKGAQWALGEPDDAFPQFAAYHIQQSVEKIVKCCLKELGVNYTKTHRISDLVARLPEGQTLIAPEWAEWLRRNAATLYEWESGTRYVDDYFVERKFAQTLYNEAVNFYNSVTTALKEADQKAEDALQHQEKPECSSGASRLDLGIKK